jgi:hypothetical protein
LALDMRKSIFISALVLPVCLSVVGCGGDSEHGARGADDADASHHAAEHADDSADHAADKADEAAEKASEAADEAKKANDQ